MNRLLKFLMLVLVLEILFIYAVGLHAATITTHIIPSPGKGHQAQVPQVLQPLWVADTAAANEVDKPGEVYTATGYCSCQICCGIWSADHPSRVGTDYQQLTASGTVPTAGRTCGADWATLPPGTVIEIEGYGQRVVEDKPAAWVVDRYQGKIIDLYCASHEEAQAVGKQDVLVKVVSKCTQ